MSNIFKRRPIPGHENYGATKCGKIFSFNYKKEKGVIKEMSYVVTKDGYLRVGLSKSGTKINYLVHRLIAQTFLKNKFNFPEINHKDGNKANNKVDNLEWCTRGHNIQHAVAKGLHNNVGSKNGCAILNEAMVEKIKQNLTDNSYYGQFRDLGDDYGVSPQVISDIKNNKKWGHVKWPG